ncbi:MAG TPA: type II toxin-antitoxin system RelE family toxin [Candidatus Wunengus sp. YC65]
MTRILIGQHRIVYFIDHNKKVITVHKIGHRRDICR